MVMQEAMPTALAVEAMVLVVEEQEQRDQLIPTLPQMK
jgi:hypothetical protein